MIYRRKFSHLIARASFARRYRAGLRFSRVISHRFVYYVRTKAARVHLPFHFNLISRAQEGRDGIYGRREKDSSRLLVLPHTPG